MTGKTYPFGGILEGNCHWHNGVVEKYTPVEEALVSVKRAQTMVNRRIVSNVKGLEGLLGKILVPKALAPEGSANLEVFRTGNRVAQLPGKFSLDLSKFGWGQPGEMQEFAVEVKGAGSEDRAICGKLKKLAEKHKWASNVLKEMGFSTTTEFNGPSLDFALSITREENHHRPTGGQNVGYAVGALEYSKKCAQGKSPIKIAPVVEILDLPREIITKINHLEATLPSGDRGTYKGIISQEKRLMPSSLRGIHFDTASPELIVKLCKSIGKTKRERESAYQKMVEDAAKFLEVLPLKTRRAKNGYRWMRIGDIHLVYQDPFFLQDTTPHFIAKDIVIAQSGVYFVDLESLDENEKATESNLKQRQEYYITAVLRDFTRIFTAYRVGLLLCNENRICDLPMRQEEEVKVVYDLVAKINDTPNLSANIRKGCIKLGINYPNLNNKETFEIFLSSLGLRFNKESDLG